MENIALKIDELTKNWDEFHSQNSQETNQIKEKMYKVERQYNDLLLSLQRPDLSFGLNHESQDQISEYIRKGNIHPNLVRKNALPLTVGDKTSNEAIIETSIAKKIISALGPLSPIRQVASVESISTSGLDVVVQEKEFICDWVEESGERALTQSATLQKRKILLHELYGQPHASQTLLEDACVDVESWLVEQLSYSFARKENESFLLGNGTTQPEGILTSLCKDGHDNQIINCDSEEISAEDLTKLASSLDAQYQANAAFIMHKSTLLAIQNLKDTAGRFLWQPKLSYNMPETLLGKQVFCCEHMPEYQNEKSDPIVLLGDFKSGYKVVDHKEITIMRDPYSHKPFVSFYAVKRVGGALLNRNAVVALGHKKSR